MLIPTVIDTGGIRSPAICTEIVVVLKILINYCSFLNLALVLFEKHTNIS